MTKEQAETTKETIRGAYHRLANTLSVLGMAIEIWDVLDESRKETIIKNWRNAARETLADMRNVLNEGKQ